MVLSVLHSSLLCLPSESCLRSEHFKGQVSSQQAPYYVRHGHAKVGYTNTPECHTLL